MEENEKLTKSKSNAPVKDLVGDTEKATNLKFAKSVACFIVIILVFFVILSLCEPSKMITTDVHYEGMIPLDEQQKTLQPLKQTQVDVEKNNVVSLSDNGTETSDKEITTTPVIESKDETVSDLKQKIEILQYTIQMQETMLDDAERRELATFASCVTREVP